MRNKPKIENKGNLLEIAAERWADIVLQQIAYRKENKDQISYENKNYGNQKD